MEKWEEGQQHASELFSLLAKGRVLDLERLNDVFAENGFEALSFEEWTKALGKGDIDGSRFKRRFEQELRKRFKELSALQQES